MKNDRPTRRELYPPKEILQVTLATIVALAFAVFLAWLMTSVR